MIDLTESAESGSDSDSVIRRTTKKADDILNFLVSSVVPICTSTVGYIITDGH